MAFGRVGALGAGFSRLGAGGRVSGPVGGAALLLGEANGFAVDFTYATDAQRVAVKTSGAIVYSGLSFFTNSSSSSKWVYNVAGTLTNVAAGSLAIDYDPVTHVVKGLLVEPLATNMLLNNSTLSTQSVTVTAAAHTLSIFGTGTVTLTGTSTAGPLAGTGANNRVSLTFTPTAGSLTLTVTGSVTRGQLELGTVATSPIVTAGTATQRAADVVKVTPASIGNSATLGSWRAEFTNNAVLGNARVIGYAAGSTPIFVNSATTFGMFEGPSFFTKTVASVLGSHKLAAAMQDGSRAITADGLAVVADATAGALSAPGVAIGIGCDGAAGDTMNAHIRKIVYVPRRMNNAELIAAST